MNIKNLTQTLMTLVCTVVLNMSLVASAMADDISQSEAQLQEVTRQLNALQKALAESEQKATSEQKALRTVESELGAVQRKVSELQQKLSRQTATLQQLQEEQATLKERLAEKESDIQAILRLAYKQNNQPLIKLLLSGERPEKLSRHLYYFSRLTATQQALLAEWVREQQQLGNAIVAEKATLQAIETQQTELAQQQKELVTQKNRRAKVVADLNQQALSTKAEIERKQEEQAKLGELIAELKQRVAAYDLEFPSATEVGKVKGKLPWPVEGRLLNRYGRSINNSELTWQGWLIGSPDGTPVRAVHGGRILFADFFKSNGLLIIVDHGDGVWTLYGRNQTLLRDVGSWVDAGDVIAEVGRSGGYSESGLYFEVRYNGEPQNPASWLQKQ